MGENNKKYTMKYIVPPQGIVYFIYYKILK